MGTYEEKWLSGPKENRELQSGKQRKGFWGRISQ